MPVLKGYVRCPADAHWSYDTQDVFTTYPNYKCIIANYYRWYDQVRQLVLSLTCMMQPLDRCPR